MRNFKVEIEAINKERQLITDKYSEELNKKKQEWVKLGDFVHEKIDEVNSREKEIYNAFLQDVIVNNRVDFSKIIQLNVAEKSYDETGEEFLEYKIYRNILIDDFKVENYTQYKESNSPEDYNWNSLISVLKRLNSNKENLNISYDEEWNDMLVKDKDNLDEYRLFLRRFNDKIVVEMDIDTENEDGYCELNLYFDLKWEE